MVRDIALWGIALNVAGVLGLFYFGMPFKLPTGGAFILGTGPDPRQLMLERVYGILGTIALLFTLAGAGLQAYAVWLSP
jgi:hypothetical protein